MRKIWMVSVISILISASCFAQERTKPRTGYFFFVAPGERHDNGTAALQIGGGAEGYIYKGLGLGFDVGGLRAKSNTGISKWAFIMSWNAIYNFNSTDRSKLSPFIIGGLTGIPQFDVSGGYNFGGGIHYWFSNQAGLRVEFRDHVLTGMYNHHWPQARIAIVFRRAK